MTLSHLQFDAVSEARPGPKWQARWERSWPAYREWFIARGGEPGPSRTDCEQALEEHMPELVPTWRRLSALAGDDDLAARFLSSWCPPTYLGGCSLAALSRDGSTRLVRNYDLSPELNEGFLLRSAWTGTPVMGMIEFLWGLSDGINEHGLAVALAYGGRDETARGFGITTIVRYLLETCHTVADALSVLQRVPSHMAYNLSLADRDGMTLSVELQPGGGLRIMRDAIATNHQHGAEPASRPAFTQTVERLAYLANMIRTQIAPADMAAEFLVEPLFQTNYVGGLGTLFTADYDPADGELTLWWPDGHWRQRLHAFEEGTRQVNYAVPKQGSIDRAWKPAVAEQIALEQALPSRVIESEIEKNDGTYAMPDTTPHWLDAMQTMAPHVHDRDGFERWLRDARTGEPDWVAFGQIFHPPLIGDTAH